MWHARNTLLWTNVRLLWNSFAPVLNLTKIKTVFHPLKNVWKCFVNASNIILFFCLYKARTGFSQTGCVAINLAGTVNQNRYRCKQCRSRWDGSNEPSHQDLHCLPFCFFDFGLSPLFTIMGMSKSKDGRVHIRNSEVKGLSLLGSFQAKALKCASSLYGILSYVTHPCGQRY